MNTGKERNRERGTTLGDDGLPTGRGGGGDPTLRAGPSWRGGLPPLPEKKKVLFFLHSF